MDFNWVESPIDDLRRTNHPKELPPMSGWVSEFENYSAWIFVGDRIYYYMVELSNRCRVCSTSGDFGVAQDFLEELIERINEEKFLKW